MDCRGPRVYSVTLLQSLYGNAIAFNFFQPNVLLEVSLYVLYFRLRLTLLFHHTHISP